MNERNEKKVPFLLFLEHLQDKVATFHYWGPFRYATVKAAMIATVDNTTLSVGHFSVINKKGTRTKRQKKLRKKQNVGKRN